MTRGKLQLEDGLELAGEIFGAVRPTSGEAVFSTGMVGYPESITDPSYCGQLLTFTYPLIGNYGTRPEAKGAHGIIDGYESDVPQVAGVVVATESSDNSHWTSKSSFSAWLASHDVPGISGIDTRALTAHLRDKGSMLGRIVCDDSEPTDWYDPNLENLVARVSTREPVDYGVDGPRVVLVDTGVKLNIVRSLLRAGARVRRVPWDHDFHAEEFDAICLANGPGNPALLDPLVDNVRRALADSIPIFGVCLGNQILARAAGAETYKLRFGHRSQNQPCIEVGTERCYVTSQNHGYAVDGDSLPDGWREWFRNANDGSNEGIRHEWKPFRSVQFHPEATPGPVDTAYLFERFLEMVG
ncbi:MAG: glutamine-hydrolyzing carbamoyl-phosphate synthase small subunit [Acidobacteriota bacterium]